MSTRAIDRVLEALRRVDLDYRPSSSDSTRWMGQCPAHDDREASLSIRDAQVGNEGERGVLLNCFAGCSNGDVVAALGLDLADLYDGERRTNGSGKGTGRSKRAKQQAEAVRAKTDLGNAERLVTAHGPDLRYVPGLGWHVWDGRRFRRDTDGAVMRFAKQVPRRMLEEAARLEDADARKELVAWAVKSESEPRLRAMVTLAETEETVVAAPSALDAHLFLFNVENGTIDLTSGEQREHRRDDLLTRLAPVVYEPNARDPAWDAFLESTTGGDGELTAFLRRAAGYTLTGDTREEALFFAHGREATGKSTYLEALKATLGDYAKVADFETLSPVVASQDRVRTLPASWAPAWWRASRSTRASA